MVKLNVITLGFTSSFIRLIESRTDRRNFADAIKKGFSSFSSRSIQSATSSQYDDLVWGPDPQPPSGVPVFAPL